MLSAAEYSICGVYLTPDFSCYAKLGHERERERGWDERKTVAEGGREV